MTGMLSRQITWLATLGSVVVGLVISGPVLGQNAPNGSAAPYERRAIDTVRAFVAAFDAKDADRAVSDFADDVQFRMEVALNRNIETGRENARQQLRRLFERVSAAARTGNGPRMLGGKIDLVQTEAVGSFFRVDGQTGNIEEWLDVPLVAFDRNPPPW